MKISEIIIENEELNEMNISLKKGLATLALASALSSSFAIKALNTSQSIHTAEVKTDPELTKVGRAAINNLPDAIKNKIGDINTIEFVKGIPPGAWRSNAICQVGKGERVIYVNPKYADKFLSGDADQLTAHELTHIAQDNMSKNMQNKFPETNPDESKMYGDMTSPDAWKILQDARKKGDRMWNHSREEQAMIVQQRANQVKSLNILKDNISNKNVDQEKLKDLIDITNKKISVYNQYVDDYNDK